MLWVIGKLLAEINRLCQEAKHHIKTGWVVISLREHSVIFCVDCGRRWEVPRRGPDKAMAHYCRTGAKCFTAVTHHWAGKHNYPSVWGETTETKTENSEEYNWGKLNERAGD